MLKSDKIFKSIKPIAAIATLALIGCTCACGPADSKAADPDVARSYDVSKVQKDEEIAKLNDLDFAVRIDQPRLCTLNSIPLFQQSEANITLESQALP